MLPPTSRFRDRMKCLSMAKFRLTFGRLTTMRSGKESLSLGKVDLVAQ